MTKNICFFSSSRADFGIQKKLILSAQADPEIDSSLVISGGHTDPRFGGTRGEIDGTAVEVTLSIDFSLEEDSGPQRLRQSNAMAAKLADFLWHKRPDAIVLLGDRFEVHAAAQAAVFCGIPIVHIHGGELSQGSADELFRHSISKLSSLHLPSSAGHALRLSQLGEAPGSILNIGSLAIEQLLEFDFYEREHIAEVLGLELSIPQVLVTYHPVSLDLDATESEISALVDALVVLSEDVQIHLSMPNSDNGFEIVEKEIERLLSSGRNVKTYRSMGQRLYYSCLKHMDLLVGNSSSGLIEAPILGIPVIDFGVRQFGRERPAEVLEVSTKQTELLNACRNLLSRQPRKVELAGNPFCRPNSSKQALSFLKEKLPLQTRKIFYDQ